MGILTTKMTKNIFEIIYIFTAAKNYTSNVSDTPFGHDHCTSLNVFLIASSNQPDFQCILFKNPNFVIFFTFSKQIYFIPKYKIIYIDSKLPYLLTILPQKKTCLKNYYACTLWAYFLSGTFRHTVLLLSSIKWSGTYSNLDYLQAFLQNPSQIHLNCQGMLNVTPIIHTLLQLLE